MNPYDSPYVVQVNRDGTVSNTGYENLSDGYAAYARTVRDEAVRTLDHDEHIIVHLLEPARHGSQSKHRSMQCWSWDASK